MRDVQEAAQKDLDWLLDEEEREQELMMTWRFQLGDPVM